MAVRTDSPFLGLIVEQKREYVAREMQREAHPKARALQAHIEH